MYKKTHIFLNIISIQLNLHISRSHVSLLYLVKRLHSKANCCPRKRALQPFQTEMLADEAILSRAISFGRNFREDSSHVGTYRLYNRGRYFHVSRELAGSRITHGRKRPGDAVSRACVYATLRETSLCVSIRYIDVIVMSMCGPMRPGGHRVPATLS